MSSIIRSSETYDFLLLEKLPSISPPLRRGITIELDHALMIKDASDEVKSNSYLFYAFLGCIFFGVSNFISGELGGRLGVPGGYPFFIGNIICWIVYHLVIAISALKSKGHLWSQNESMYYDSNTKTIRWDSYLALLMRSVV
jgi:hypothetical protein